MQNQLLEISSKPNFEPKTLNNRPKVGNRTCPELPRPVQEDKYLLQTSGNAFIFQILYNHRFYKINLLLFYGIIGFTK